MTWLASGIEPRRARWRPIVMERVIGEILEILLTAVVAAIGRLFGVANAFELATAIVGLGFIAVGCGLWWFGS